jgi:hypothetical protein
MGSVGVDSLIVVSDKVDGGIRRMNIAASPWVEGVTSQTAAFGEVMATTKADLRLRAALAGEDPNSPALKAI